MKHSSKNAISRNARVTHRLRTKDTSGSDLSEVIEKIGKGFESYKAANDERLKQIEKSGSSDPVTEEKLAKVEAEMKSLTELKDDLEKLKSAVDVVSLKANRPPGAGEQSAEQIAHKTAFAKYLRKGSEDNLEDLQVKALNIGVDGDGGFAVTEQLDTEIASLLQEVSPIRTVARVITVGSSDYKKLVNVHGTASGWVGETTSRPGTGTPGLEQVVPPIGEIYANPAATQTMLDDAFFNAEAWLAEEVQTEFAKQEGVAFISGDGTNKPKGFLAYATAATKDASRAFGIVQHVVTGAAAGFATSDPGDVLLDVFYSMKGFHRQNSSWMMNSESMGNVRKLKDSDGGYLWRPGLIEGEPATLLGRPIVTAEDMPGFAADATPIALGNWNAAYYVIDRMGTRVLRDPFTNKPYVQFYTTKRVGGALVDDQALKLVKLSA